MAQRTGNRGFHPVHAYVKDMVLCENCKAYLAMEEYEPLTIVDCPHCEEEVVIPMKIGKFWLHEHLGGGGMGEVYKAYHQEFPDKRFAVKILPESQKKNQRQIRHLQHEAKIMDELREHVCLANSLAWGYEDGEHFVAMEFVAGERMDQRIKRLGHLSEHEVLLIAMRLLTADVHIYNRGFLYRDLKPQNVILDDEKGAFLYDFGICVPVEAAMDDSAELIAGTPMYFPPERLTGEGESVSSEIYSLGMVMYNALTGKTYFTNRELEAMAAKEVLPATLKQRNKMEGINQDLANVIGQMIERNPKKRYQTFIEVELALMRILWVRAKRDPDGQLLKGDQLRGE